VDRRTRFIPKEKQLNFTIQDDMTQTRLSNLSSEPTMLFSFIWFSSRSLLYQSSHLAFSAFFQVIYCNLCIILTTHVYAGLGGFLPVPSNISWNHKPVAVRLLDHCSGITSTLMRSENWLRGN